MLRSRATSGPGRGVARGRGRAPVRKGGLGLVYVEPRATGSRPGLEPRLDVWEKCGELSRERANVLRVVIRHRRTSPDVACDVGMSVFKVALFGKHLYFRAESS
jgi:hypothetical protein